MTFRRWVLVILLLLPGLGLILWLMGTVVYIAVAQSFGLYSISGESHLTVAFWADLFDSKMFGRSIRYSIYVGVLSALFSVALAYPLAIWLRKPFPGSMTIGAILKAPMLVHGLVAAFLFINIVAYHGLFNQFMMWLGIWDSPHRLQNDRNAIGVLLLQTWKQMPFALLLLTGAVQGISDDVLDAARDLGAGSWARFRKVIAPLTVSGMQAAMVIIFIGALADFSFQTIAGPINRQSLSQLMVSYKGRGDWHSAAVVGVSMIVIALVGSAILAFVSRLVLKGGRK
ncbi:putative spermidine/putrescine transport system permease protein [Cohaesibacter sp. ES.047]|uniref:ABC transporter permease n=1 Tax=Cohaesibacter sp. ES.047 TaxID=1798205 RepID=UPI000BB987CE|nr:ABC transporter permease [Cohaesibacter sp. ES.047]SNY91662.1 putative spermidine/putrescine transport system permease protein [Cohaesibacter sp. ES.047]